MNETLYTEARRRFRAAWIAAGGTVEDVRRIGEECERLRQHLAWASRHGALVTGCEYLAGLPEVEWHHSA